MKSNISILNPPNIYNPSVIIILITIMRFDYRKNA